MLAVLIIAAASAIATLVPSSAEAQFQKVVCMLKGDVLTTSGEKVSGATVLIYHGSERVASTHTNSDGKFSSVVPPGATYRVTCTHPAYSYAEVDAIVPETDKYLEVPVHITVKSMTEGQAFSLNTPVFEQMKHNPKLTLAITVYPDHAIRSAKKDAAQVQLVAARANAITSYLLASGIGASQFTITQSKTVPEGQFPRSNQDSAAATGKKKKKSKSAGLMPQYIQIVSHFG